MRSATLAPAALAFVIGCGSPQPKPEPAKPAAESGQMAPLTVHRAQSKRYAIILGTGAGSHKLPLVERENSVGVDVLWYQMTTPPTGGTSPIRLRVAPQDGGDVRVGVFEQYSGGVGSMSRASVWIAAFLASTTLGQDLASFRFTADIGGFVDGPSAGALLAAGYLAALTSSPVDPEATMTGAVNPDGTVGPVGGIPRKFEAAIDKGKKRLGFPLGQRISVDPATGGRVDLVELAKRRGATAVELRDVHDAYRLLTGRTLPRPTPIDAAEMAVPASVNAALDKRYKTWVTLYDHHWGQISEGLRTNALPAGIKALATEASSEKTAAAAAHRAGRLSSAYARIIDAVIYAHTARLAWAVVEDVRAGRIDDATAWIQAQIKTFESSVATMNQIGVLHPKTIGGHLQMISAFQRATAALAYATWGQQQLGAALASLAALRGKPSDVLEAPETAAAIATALSVPLVNFVRAEITARVATEALEIESVETIAYSCSEPAARRLATSYSSAAVANLRYFESLMTAMIGGSTDDVRRRVSLVEPDYIAAMIAMKMALGNVSIANELKERWGPESLAWSLQSLGGAIMTYFKSSLLISRWYSLGVERDPTTGVARSVTHQEAFEHALRTAERSAREHAHSAKVAVGRVPLQAQLAYQRGVALRAGDLDAQLRALEAFWSSSGYSQTAVVMARHVINPKKHGPHGK